MEYSAIYFVSFAFTCIRYTWAACSEPEKQWTLNSHYLNSEQGLDINSSVVDDNAMILDMVTKPGVTYTAPAEQPLTILFTAKEKKAPYIVKICVHTKCVQKIETSFFGPWEKVSFLTENKVPLWIEKSPQYFPEEKFVKNGGCDTTETCFQEPQNVTKFSLTFHTSSCEGCDALTVESVKITICTVVMDGIEGESKDIHKTVSSAKALDFRNHAEYNWASSAGQDISVLLLMLQGSNSIYTAPNDTNHVFISFEVPNKDFVNIKQVCVATKCVSKISVTYCGPWIDQHFRNINGKNVWIKSNDCYPVEEIVENPLAYKLTCFTNPEELSKLTVTFDRSANLTSCGEISVKELRADN